MQAIDARGFLSGSRPCSVDIYAQDISASGRQ